MEDSTHRNIHISKFIILGVSAKEWKCKDVVLYLQVRKPEIPKNEIFSALGSLIFIEISKKEEVESYLSAERK